MSCSPKRSCQQAAKLQKIQTATEVNNAPLTPGLSVFGALGE